MRRSPAVGSTPTSGLRPTPCLCATSRDIGPLRARRRTRPRHGSARSNLRPQSEREAARSSRAEEGSPAGPPGGAHCVTVTVAVRGGDSVNRDVGVPTSRRRGVGRHGRAPLAWSPAVSSHLTVSRSRDARSGSSRRPSAAPATPPPTCRPAASPPPRGRRRTWASMSCSGPATRSPRPATPRPSPGS